GIREPLRVGPGARIIDASWAFHGDDRHADGVLQCLDQLPAGTRTKGRRRYNDRMGGGMSFRQNLPCMAFLQYNGLRFEAVSAGPCRETVDAVFQHVERQTDVPRFRTTGTG